MSKWDMFTTERLTLIHQYIKENSRATVDELAEKFYVSKATIRRDLTEMQKMGMIKRTHGGAIDNVVQDETSIFIRKEESVEGKREIANLALKHVPDFQTCFIDNSSTCLAFVKIADFGYKTVVTNGLEIAIELSRKKNVSLFLLGGNVQYNTYSTNGIAALKMLEEFNFDLCLTSCTGFSLDCTSERSFDTAQIKRAAYKNSKKKVLLADKSKKDKSYFNFLMKLSAYDMIITDASKSQMREYLEGNSNILCLK